MARHDYPGKERREYVRLDSVFPVQFRLLAIDGEHFLSDWLQGFTNDVGRGGICLSVNNLNPELARLLKEGQAKISLDIEMPLARKPVPAKARIVWIAQAPGGNPNKYLIGLSYEKIDHFQNNRIMRYVWAKKIFIPVALSIIFILGSVIAVNSLINAKLIKDNRALVEQLVKTVQESSIAEEKIGRISKEREDLEARIKALEPRIQTIEREKSEVEANARLATDKQSRKMEELSGLIKELSVAKAALEEQLVVVQRKEDAVVKEIVNLSEEKVSLEQANVEKMYQWLKVHQNPRTGLVISFEGDNDIANWAFIYDQSLVAQAYTLFSDFQRARRIFDFFNTKAKRRDRQFYNAYYANDGSPSEYVVQSGPNIWLGIAIMQYTQKSGDSSYVRLAEEIAQAIIDLQGQDKDGGIRGGPGIEWYATEHNLDAYSFFNMLYKITGRVCYQEAANKVLSWLVRYTYDKAELPIKRGKGDSTIATDTYAWSIAAVGPRKLEEIGMDPDRIVEFAEQNCSVEVAFLRPEGQTVKVRGFDFASQRNLARGGVVSSEWTGQMVMAYKIMADYYKDSLPDKSRAYARKADEYLSELSNMIISSPSPSGQGESCLPYATQDSADTGHGWSTPKGKSTGSVAGTTYTLFAYYNYNPLELRD
ncbi:MAG: PilZ domain-containing protein [Candidatus Omnitrophota bacterium]